MFVLLEVGRTGLWKNRGKSAGWQKSKEDEEEQEEGKWRERWCDDVD